MARNPTLTILSAVPLDHNSLIPLYAQLYSGIRHAVLLGQLRPGSKLPSTRVLSAQLGISRNTVLNAFDQLVAEGYIGAKHGSGTYVADTVPDQILWVSSQPERLDSYQVRDDRAPSHRSHRFMEIAYRTPKPLVPTASGRPRAFREGIPALDMFPRKLWGRLLARAWRRSAAELIDYGTSHPLREAIAEYLITARGVRCNARQVIIVTGSQQAINLAAQVLLDPGDVVWIEDPGYPGAYGGLMGAGARVIPTPIDKEGLDVKAAASTHPQARLAFVTPSHQFPIGITMSLARRLELLDWAHRNNAWILEDDYDSEYRYTGRPLAALHAIDSGQRVIYLGTFSKVMFPALRLGYLVVPSDLVDAFNAGRKFTIQHPPLLEQAALSDFIAEGHLGRHIRRMRELYAKRRALLVQALQQATGDLLEIEPGEAGMHLLAWLPRGVDDVFTSRKLAAHGVDAIPLSIYATLALERGALLLGYAGIAEEEIELGVKRMASALR